MSSRSSCVSPRCDRFLIVSNYFKTSKIQQLYRLSMAEKAVTQCEENKIPFVVDTYYHQYHLKDASSNVYLLGGNYVHKINFREKTWDTISKGSYDLN